MATAEFSKFAGILSAALSQHHLSGHKITFIYCFPVSLGQISRYRLVRSSVQGSLMLKSRCEPNICQHLTRSLLVTGIILVPWYCFYLRSQFSCWLLTGLYSEFLESSTVPSCSTSTDPLAIWHHTSSRAMGWISFSKKRPVTALRRVFLTKLDPQRKSSLLTNLKKNIDLGTLIISAKSLHLCQVI